MSPCPLAVKTPAAAGGSRDLLRSRASGNPTARGRSGCRATPTSTRRLPKHLAADERELETLLGQLTSEWRSQVPNLREADVDSLDQEREQLERGGVGQRYEELQKDAVSLQAWVERRDALVGELAGVAAGSVGDAERGLAAAEETSRIADKNREAARAEVNRLEAAAGEFRKLAADLKNSELDHDRHRKLADWLGEQGLLRELVRDAERDIVRFAQETLQNLSGGDLEIELQDPSDGKDKALVLLVRRAGDGLPIPVKFLSGSQKFRVAVAIAVAIGKFAAGTSSARPLESVIIDEGFGSLDKDGLNAMREELENLKDSQALKRVILVSHQEEFTKSFPVGYRLAATANRTVATPFRHSGG